MMMERAKTAPSAPPTQSSDDETKKTTVVVVGTGGEDEKISDLERRLKSLEGTTSASSTSIGIPPPATPQDVASVASTSAKSNPLLKRIQAAQERARLAEQKEKDDISAKLAEEAERVRLAEEEAHAEEERKRIKRAQEQLRAVAGRALEDRQRNDAVLAQLEGGTASSAAATAAVPIMKSMDPPPPSFDSMRFPPPMMAPGVGYPGAMMVGHGMNSRALTQPPPPTMTTMVPPPPPPPSFDFVERRDIVVPSAPPLTPTEEEGPPTDLLGLLPVPPPTLQQQEQWHARADVPPPPSFAEFESQHPSDGGEVTIFDYDDAGNPLSPEQRQALLDEQRILYEQIMTEKAANDAAIASARAEAFDNRSSTAAVRAMPGGGGGVVGMDALTPRDREMDFAGRDIVEADTAGEAGASSTGRMVRIGNNQMVALHGQDRTKKAIREGTAVLVQCINCQNWMQVTDSATLMFCPVCQVVSPVIKQNEVLTKEEAIQLTMDRKLAEKLQAEYNSQGVEDAEVEGGGKSSADDEGYLARFFGSGATKYPATKAGSGAPAKSEAADSWWDKISSIVSYGVAHDDGTKERGELGVTRPPGTFAKSSPVAINDRSAPSAARNEETRGLLSPVVVDGGNEANLPAARVAEQRPLFSCVMDSVSSATSALWSTTGQSDREGNMYGVDASSLLVTNAGRGVGDGAGDYAQLPDRE